MPGSNLIQRRLAGVGAFLEWNEMERKTLSKEDVEKLLSSPSGEIRAETAAKIASDFNQGALTDSERKLAEEIFRIMVKDAEVRVREALSQNLKESSVVPHDVAMTLANDVDSVALPVLEFSKILSDEDLLEIVRGQDVSKQVAIASRSNVSEALSDALVETKNEEVVTSLVSNEGADISEKTFQKWSRTSRPARRCMAPWWTAPSFRLPLPNGL